MTELFALTDLEAHLVEEHDVSVEMISAVRARWDKPAHVIEEQSHTLMHAMEMPMKGHSHE